MVIQSCRYRVYTFEAQSDQVIMRSSTANSQLSICLDLSNTARSISLSSHYEEQSNTKLRILRRIADQNPAPAQKTMC